MSDSTPARSLGGRFTEPTHPVLDRINRSVEVDRRMWRQDIRGSRAHARMLGSVGLLAPDDVAALLDGLQQVEDELAAGTFVLLPTDEDIHMAVERRLGELIGEPARRLHTGRSRNDQVMTDVLLWLRDEAAPLRAALQALRDAALRRADDGADLPMPSFTHLQPAQVSSGGAWMLSLAVEVDRHLRRLDDWVRRLDACPLGSGASAGSYLPLDRRQTATELGFAVPSPSAIAATGTRTDLLDALALLAMVGVTLSRLGEEIVLFASPAYGFVRLPDGLTTGSSLLPHKRNPDGAELLRAGGKLPAQDFAALASVCAGLVSGYSKDLQYDKELLFRSWDRVTELLALALAHVERLAWVPERMAAACQPELAALWLADRLVTAGMPFRAAHHVVGAAVRLSQEQGTDLAGGLLQVEGAPDREALAAELRTMTPAALLTGLRTEGSAAPDRVREAVARLR
jgi:argininosuccinate lyase